MTPVEESVVDRNPVQFIEIGCPTSGMDVDTPDELARAETILAQREHRNSGRSEPSISNEARNE